MLRENRLYSLFEATLGEVLYGRGQDEDARCESAQASLKDM